MKNIFLLIFLLSYGYIWAHDEFPKINKFDVEHQVISNTGKTIWTKETYQFLMLNSQKAIDLRNYGNKECEFEIIGNNLHKIILEYNQPSKLDTNGRCAAGSEKGILVLEFDSNANLLLTKNILLESCILSIEITSQKKVTTGVIEYLCENYQTSESYLITIDFNNIMITRKEKD